MTDSTPHPVDVSSGGPQPLHHVGVCLDRSVVGDRIIPHAIAVARAFGAKLTFVHALEPQHEGPDTRPTDPLDWELQRAAGRRHLEAAQSEYVADDVYMGSELLEGRPAEEIREWARSHDVDLTVFASHGASGWTEWGLASTARKLVEGISGSMLLVPAWSVREPVVQDVTYARILVLLDGSVRAESVLPAASGIARAHESELVLLHVVPIPDRGCPGAPEDDRLDLGRRLVERNARAAEVYLKVVEKRLVVEGARVRTLVAIDGDVRAEILRRVAEDDVDLLALSGHGRGGRPELPLGSVASFLLEHATVPILVVREPTSYVAGRPPGGRSTGGVRLPQPTES